MSNNYGANAIIMDDNFKEIFADEIEVTSKYAPICPCLLGEPGIGKSAIIESICKDRGWHFFSLLCHQLGDRSDLTGGRTVKVEEMTDGKLEEIWKQVFFPHQEVQDAISCAKKNPNDIVMLFLDEINRTSPDITSAILAFTTARRIGSYRFPDNIRFAVAGNDDGNINNFDSASVTRFAMYKLIPYAKTYMDYEENLHEGQTLNPYIKAVLTANPDLVLCYKNSTVTSYSEDENGETVSNEFSDFSDCSESAAQFTTPRTLSGLNVLLNSYSKDKLARYIGTVTRNPNTGEEIPMLRSIITAHVGDTEFADKLCALIADDISKGILQKANNIPKPIMPMIYNDIKRCTDRQTRDAMLANMSNEDISPVILYAVYEHGVNNKDIITALAQNYNGQFLTGDYQQQFIALKTHDELDSDNYSALIDSNTELGNTTKMLLGE